MFTHDVALVSMAAALGSAATWIAVRVARLLGIVNHPNPIVPQHTRPVAYLGGVAVAVGALAALGLLNAMSTATPPPSVTVVVPALLFLLLGLVDDVHALAPLHKFLLQSTVAATAVGLGARAQLTGVSLVDDAIAWFWIVTIVNACNLIDVSDGLLAGLSVVMLGSFPYLDPTPLSSGLALVLCGSSAGFLMFNLPPATIFLGDAGSHLLGYMLAFLTLEYVDRVGTWPAVPGVMLVAAVPLFELLLLITERRKKGIPWWRGSRDHFALRLQAAGFKRWHVNGLAWAIAAVMCAIAAKFVTATVVAQLTMLLVTAVAFAVCWTALLRLDGRPSDA